MKAAIFNETGKPDVLKIEDVPVPEINDDEVLVEVKAASVNPIDAKLRTGFRLVDFPLPATPGYDFSGVVKKVGSKVLKFKEGDEVYSGGADLKGKGGSYAEFVAVNEVLVSLKPKNLSFEEAASIPLIGITSWECLVDKLKIEKGEKLLVHGGAGGVGSVAIQIAKSLGAEVYTTVSSKEKEDFVEELGATPINYKEEDFVEFSKKIGGFDKVLDIMCGEVFTKSLKALKPYGEIVTILPSFEKDMDLFEPWVRNISIHFVCRTTAMNLNLKDRMARHGKVLDELRKLAEDGKLKAQVKYEFPLNQVVEAHELLEKGGMIGKIVIKISE